ncbi:hypothetical protein [Nocardia sp. NRRL S-836]|uniref:hypothetical protein n=1 Tax=Nocardia sp. NRRL S-836 TaxID=1519492 RepID=UPI0006AFD85D|nr:hypothetical protein [Nocardia sp. NRRL S-836]
MPVAFFANFGLNGPTRAVGTVLREVLAHGSTDPAGYLPLVGGYLHPAPLLLRLGFTASDEEYLPTGPGLDEPAAALPRPTRTPGLDEVVEILETRLSRSIWDDDSDDMIGK